MSSVLPTPLRLPCPLADLALGLVGVLILAVLAAQALQAPAALPLSSGLGYLAIAFLIVAAWPTEQRRFGWANRITLLRAMLIAVLAGSLWWPALWQQHAISLVGIAAAALLLDGVDGWVARRTGSVSDFGARFDMELDAGFILLLCLALVVVGKVAAWALLIGAMRYVFVVSGRRWPWLQAPLPESLRRKAVCVWQIAALMLALLPGVSDPLAAGLAATALAGLTASFAVDVAWLYRKR